MQVLKILLYRKNEVNEQNIKVIQELNEPTGQRGRTFPDGTFMGARDDRVTSALIGASSTQI